MKMDSYLVRLFKDGVSNNLKEKFEKFKTITASGFGNFSSKSFIVADLLKLKQYNKVLWLVNDKTEQENLVRSLKLWSNYKVHAFYKDPDVFDKKINDAVIMETVAFLYDKEKTIVVCPYNQFLEKIPKKENFNEEILVLKKGEKIKIVDVFEKLIELGYEVSEDQFMKKGTYYKQGENLYIYPINKEKPIQIVLDFDTIETIYDYDQLSKKEENFYDCFDVYPLILKKDTGTLLDYLDENSLIIDDELEILEQYALDFEDVLKNRNKEINVLKFTSFPEDDEWNVHEHFLSVLKYQNLLDLTSNLWERYLSGWKMVFFTKHKDEILPLFDEKKIVYDDKLEPFSSEERHALKIVSVEKEGILPHPFQNPKLKVFVFSDKEIATLKTTKKSITTQKVFLDFLTGLKINDFVVHADHGIARFGGVEKKTVDNITREYLKLIYAENDRLFVPIDQADKVNKFIGGSDTNEPKLTRLGSMEWNTLTKRVKKETQEIAKELLALYAKREMAKGFQFKEDDPIQAEFEKSFQYEETPGQIKAIIDVKKDMEQGKPMDRLICGDVGFGKTEVAMRASFKAVRSGKQVAFISPITILADQHYRTFTKRMEPFHVRVEMLSRFKTKKEQVEILKKLQKGETDVVIGTHRLLQPDVKFKNLGLLIIDEEQRFGVKQKEQFKNLRSEIDIMTMTATPIPRTLNISLNKLRDITTITTPPPGRLPVVTEVRKFSLELIKEAIYQETKRKGQVYILHNRVQTIDGFAERLRGLCPDVRFIVGHGKLSSSELEKRIIAFKNGEYDVLVSSTIIENGIDLANANTLIVDSAERFGLAQLYQLRGRVGRGKTQAYAYFLYHAQRLRPDAKKRLKAIVEASELGSGFQIAMKDLEIRGAGDILGANQHGTMNVVGVSHFIRMLNKAVEEMKEGLKEGEDVIVPDVSIEIPISAYIPDDYIVSSKDKINAYQRLSGADSMEYLEELKEDLIEEYGKMPNEVLNLFKVLELKFYAKKANLLNVKGENIHDAKNREIVLTMSKNVKPENIFKLLEYNSKWIISGNKLKIKTSALGLKWFEELMTSIQKLVPEKKIK